MPVKRRSLAPAAIFCGVLAVVLALSSGSALASTSDPAYNTPLNGVGNCSMSTVDNSSSCLTGAKQNYNTARANEGMGSLNLPSNWTSLTDVQQSFVLVNMDRAERGLNPMDGISSTLNTYAQGGVNNNSDPAFPSWTQWGGGNWASTGNSLWSEYLWMYFDGCDSASNCNSSNLDCTSSTSAGCWGHRHNVLGTYPKPALMGVAAGSDGSHGTALLFMGGDTHDSADFFKWSTEIPYFVSGSPENPTSSSGTSLMVTPNSPPHGAYKTAYTSGGPIASAVSGTAPYAWSSSTLPAGLSLNTTTGYVTGTPTVTGSYPVTVVVQDATGATASTSVTLVIDAAVPSAPQSVSAVAGHGSATVSWAAPASNGGAAISEYKVQYSSDGGSTWSASTYATGSPATVTGLTNGTSYVFWVAAVNSAGQGPWSANSAAVTPTAPVTPLPSATTMSLPTFQADTPNSFHVGATGGSGGYTYTFLSNTHTPHGLTMSSAGVVSANVLSNVVATSTGPGDGTPWNFNYTVTDSAGHTSAVRNVTLSFTPGAIYWRCLGTTTVEAGNCATHSVNAAYGTIRRGAFYNVVAKTGRGWSANGDWFTMVKGAIPPGMKLVDLSGKQGFFLQGTPTQTGTWTFYMNGKDAHGLTTGLTYYTITVS